MTGPLAPLAVAVRADLADLAGRVLVEIDAGLPELGRDPRVRELLVGTVQGSLEGALAVLVGSGDPEEVPLPPVAGELARRLAQQGVAVTVLLRAYRLGQAVFQQDVITRIAGAGLGPDEMVAAVRELTAVAHLYVDRVSEEMVAVHQAERDGWVRRRDAARLAMVDAVLGGRGGTTAEIESALGHPVTGEHRAAVFWAGPEAPDPGRALERAVGAVGEQLGCARTPLVVAPDAATLWAWYPCAGGPVELPDGPVRAALGPPGTGVEGFRRSHAVARRVQAVAAAAAPAACRPVTTADDLGPLLLLGSGTDLLAARVADVLGDLALDDEQHERLRDTVGAYLRGGGSLAAAAAELHLHKNTVQYRLRRAEEVRGRPLGVSDADRLDVEVALHACRVLGAAVLRPAEG